MTWIHRLSGQRVPPQGAAPTARRPANAPAAPAPELDVAAFSALGVSEKVLKAHGANLTPAVADMRAVAEVAAGMQPHRAVQLGHALERFYGDLGRALAKLPEAERKDAAKAAIGSLRAVVGEVGASDRVIAALTVLSSLFFSRPLAAGESLADVAHAGQAELSALLTALDGRTGASSLLLGYRNLVETVEARAKPASLAERAALWAETRAYVTEASPRTGIDQAELATLVERLHLALDGAKTPVAALERAKKAAFAEHAAVFGVAKDQLSVRPNLDAKAPGMIAVDTVAKALTALLAEHRAGPDSIAGAAEGLHAQLLGAAPGITDADLPAFRAIAEVVKRVASTPVAEPVLAHLAAALPELVGNVAAVAALAGAKTAAEVPRALVSSRVAALGLADEPLSKRAVELDRLPPAEGLRVALAALPLLETNRVGALLPELISAARSGEPAEALATFAARAAEALPTLQAIVAPEHAAPLAARLAAEPGAVTPARAEQLGRLASSVLAALPGLDVGALARASKSGVPGLLALTGENAFGRDPGAFLPPLLAAIAELPRAPEAVRTALARRAIHLSAELAKLDRDPQALFQAVLADWKTALAQPAELHAATRTGSAVAVQGKAAPTALGFIDAHPELPPELAFTAGVHLSKEQVTWLVDQLASTRSHQRARILRDVVLAAVEGGHTDLIEALRTSKSSPKAVADVAQHVALEYRQGRLGTIDFERLRLGLVEGRDPIADLQAEAAKAAMAALGIAAGDLAALDAAGLATLEKNKVDVQNLLAFVAPGQPVFGADSAVFRDPLLGCLREIAAGTWPSAKYEDEVAKRQLAGLTPKQRELWAQEGVTSAAQPNLADRPELAEALPILRGLVKALPQEVKLEKAGLPALGWDRASLETLRGLHAAELAKLHDVPKGSAEHRAASAAIGPLADRLAVLELHVQLAELAGRKDTDPGTMLLALKGALGPAAAAARKLGGRGSGEALRQLAETAASVKTAPREGLFAADEDRLAAYMTSFGGGCLHPSTGFNRGALVELMASAQYKMGRIMNGDTCVGRTIIRLLKIDVGDYHGYALRMDKPLNPNNWNATPSQAETELMFKHGLDKAMAMGIPFIYHEAAGTTVAQQAGLAPQHNQAMKISIDRGHTGIHHTQGLNVGPYFVAWPGLTSGYINVWGQADQPTVQIDGAMSIVFPPK